MVSHFEILLNVSFKHEFFSDKKIRSFKVKATKQTENQLLRNGLICKTYTDGFHILFETIFLGNERTREQVLKGGAVLEFTLLNNDQYFFNYTLDMMSDLSEQLFYFSNINAMAGLLHKKEFVSSEDLNFPKEYEQKFFAKPFGVIEIKLDESLAENNIIHFDSKSTYWQYLVTTPFLKDLPLLAVVNKDTKEKFDGPQQISLPGNKTALLFLSANQIPMREIPDRAFQLIQYAGDENEKFKIIKSILPNPCHKDISGGYAAKGQDEKKVSKIFI